MTVICNLAIVGGASFHGSRGSTIEFVRSASENKRLSNLILLFSDTAWKKFEATRESSPTQNSNISIPVELHAASSLKEGLVGI